MNAIDKKILTEMGTQLVGGAQITFYTNATKDTLFVEGILKDSTQTPNINVLKKITQPLTGEFSENNAQQFLKQLMAEKRTNCLEILHATPAIPGTGRSFVRETETDKVTKGDYVGFISEPQHGQDGINLNGNTIPAPISDELNFSYDESITIIENKVFANHNGKLIFNHRHKTLTIGEPYQFEFSEDKTEGYLTYIDTIPVTDDCIRQLLIKNRVSLGILDEHIKKIIARHTEDLQPIKKVLIAKGTPVTLTQQGYIAFDFEQASPNKIDEATDQIDYKNLYKTQNIKQGERLAKIYPPVIGKPGLSIQGKLVQPENPKTATLRPLKNVYTNPEGTEFFAGKDGMPIYKNGCLSVIETMLVSGHLSLATGNIDFEGNVIIEGDVGDDYIVKAEGDIMIGGSVGSSKLIAGRHIQIEQGFNGRGTGYAECTGNLSVKFIKDVTLNCEGDVYIETEALNSNINSLGQLMMPRGNLIGGEASVLSGIFVNNIGSALGVQTKVNPGVSFFYMNCRKKVENKISELQQKITNIHDYVGPILKDKTKFSALSYEKKMHVKSLMDNLRTLELDLEYTQKEQIKTDEMKELSINEVVVYTGLYQGAIFKIRSAIKEFKNYLSGPLLVTEDIENATIRTGPIKMRNKVNEQKK